MLIVQKIRTFTIAATCVATLMLPLLLSVPGAAQSTPAQPTVGTVKINATTRNNTAAKATVQLARDGKALMPIVISARAGVQTKAVAEELAAYLKRITGATFDVTTGDGAGGIVLGTIAEFPTPGLEKALEIFPGGDGREAFAIRTSDKRLLLLGATELAASHAAFRFLHELGYRHFFEDPAWVVFPEIRQLSFNRDITDRPSILSRDIWQSGSGNIGELVKSFTIWKRHNLHAQSFVVSAGHNLDTVIRINKEEFDKHPEYYALVKQADGTLKRDPDSHQPELANPVVRKMIVDYAVNYFKENPGADMVSLDPADTTAHSVSPESLKLGSVSDRIFGIANEAARAIEQAYPGHSKMVGILSYNAHWDPPTFNVEPNVHVQVASLGQGEYRPAEREKVLAQRSRNLGAYEYYSVWLWTYDRLPGTGANDLRGLQARMRDLVRRGFTSVSAQGTTSWGSDGLGYYVANRLMWNPDLNVDAVAQDFYDKAFGAGGPAMQRYYERLRPGEGFFLSKHLLGLAFRDVDEASRLTAGRPDIQARLDQMKLYLRYVHLDWVRNREPATPERQAELSRLIMTHFYRTRYMGLMSYEMARQYWAGNKYPEQDGVDWADDTPLAHQAIERDFQEGLKHFVPRTDIGTTSNFSKDLVPVVWHDHPQIESQQHYQGAAKYALYSINGEPLEFVTWAGDAWGGINRFTLTDVKGTEIYHQDKLPNKETSKHRITVPGPGLYYLDYNDNGSYWNMTVAPGKVATIPMGQQQDYRNSQVMPEMYFYVPKGTRHIQYFYTRTNFHPGGAHKVVDPSGKVVQDVDVNGDWVSVPVPAGQDGKLWRLQNAVLGLFWFNTVPNYLAASPDALLVPREVAVKDGLTLRK